jgi:hypothetical protein
MNPATCGVAKFNHRLARELGVPCEPLAMGHAYRSPLSSIKASEMGRSWLMRIPAHGDILLHDRPSRLPMHRRIFYADEIGCPATIDGNPTRGRYRVLTFGMAHKRLLPHYIDLKVQLDEHHPDYTLEMSTAIHEGNPWDAGLEQSICDMRAIFGDHLRVLGFLGDDALAKELQDCDAVAVYFVPAFRRNNTTGWAALAAGKPLYTNRDEQSPTVMPTWDSVIAQLGATASTTPSSCPKTRSESPAGDRFRPDPPVSDPPSPSP